ncbi:unnamed protein product [Mucor hiemalis]
MNIFSFCLNSIYNANNIIDSQLLTETSNKYGSSISFTPLHYQQAATGLNILLLSDQTDSIKGELLRKNPIKSILSINSPNVNALFHTEIKTSLTKIAQKQNIEIQVHASSEPEIHMFGSIHAIESARVEILVLLDQLSGLRVDSLDHISLHLHHLIAGRKHAQLQSIMEETGTNIYLHSPFTNLCNSKDDKSSIYLTGESMTNISRAKELICKLSAQKSKSMYHKDSVMDARKIDWILLHKRIELRKIMKDNGSYLKFPVLGSGENKVSIYAENRINVERSIRLLNYLTSNIYEASFDFTTNDTSLIQRAFDGSTEKFAGVLSELSQSSAADVLYDAGTNKLELFGTERQIRNAYQVLCNLTFFKENHQFTTFALELATDQREFISGKKNGKINKIMKSCGVSIRFTLSNEYNSSIIVESDNYVKALDGLTLLQDELPAETSFYVPEIYHRRIIGVAGKNIQKVMKKYGVYVKFSGAEEFTSMGGYFENEDNVVARTPMKNQINLENLKHSVTEFINFQKDKDYTSTNLCIPYSLHRVIPNQYGSQLRDVCRTNNAKIWWPERLGSDEVMIYGPQSQIPAVIACMEQLITTEYHVAVKVLDDNMEKTLLDENVVSSLREEAKNSIDMHIIVEHLQQAPIHQNDGQLKWVSPYDEENLIIYRFSYKVGQFNDLHKAIELVESHVNSKKFEFIPVAEKRLAEAYIPHRVSEQGAANHLTDAYINADLLTAISSPSLPITATELECNDYETRMPNGFRDVLNDIPSPPLSESHQYHPLDNFGGVSSLLSVPQPSGKNIWASPRIQSNNVIPPVIQIENMHIGYHIRAPPSPPYHMNQEANKSQIRVTPSFSAPIIGSSTTHPQHHRSWPDAFFGGRDLFDTLPIRRASSVTQSAFEFIPNSTTAYCDGKNSIPSC